MARALAGYIWGVLIALDKLGNALLAGHPNETVSTRAARARNRGDRWGCVLCKLLDSIHKNHCDIALHWTAFGILRRQRKGLPE